MKKELSIKLCQKNIFWKYPMKPSNHYYYIVIEKGQGSRPPIPPLALSLY